GSGGIIERQLIVPALQFPNFQPPIVATYFGMAVYPIQNNCPIVIAQVKIIFYGHLYGVVYLHIYVIAASPSPAPTVIGGGEICSGRNRCFRRLKIDRNIVQLALYPILLVACGLNMYLYEDTILRPRSNI